MVLEATMICLDNSAHAINGDFPVTRLDAQTQTSSLVASAKVQDNSENAVGVLTMANSRVDVLLTPTPDIATFLQCMHSIACKGECDFLRGLQTAQLVLKHRLNKNQRQRIVVFICSPLNCTLKQMEQLGKFLKKNSISLDIISFGETSLNSELLHKLIDSVNSSGNSHLLEIPLEEAGHVLSDRVTSSAIVRGEHAIPSGGPPGGLDVGLGGIDVGVDPNTDPELYMALRLSLEEERARIQRQQQQEAAVAAGERIPFELDASITGGPPAEGLMANPSSGGTDIRTAGQSDAPTTEQSIPTAMDIEGMNIPEDLRQALLLSLQDYYIQSGQQSQPTAQEGRMVSSSDTTERTSSDQQQAQEISSGVQSSERRISDTQTLQTESDVMLTPRSIPLNGPDEDTLKSLLEKYGSSVPDGVDLSDPAVMNAMLELEDADMEDAVEENIDDENKKNMKSNSENK